jgi:hypothetical protein
LVSDDEEDGLAVGWIIVGVFAFIAFWSGVAFALYKTICKKGRPHEEQREEQNEVANASPVPSQPEAAREHIVEVAPIVERELTFGSLCNESDCSI